MTPVSLGVLFDPHYPSGGPLRKARLVAGLDWMRSASPLNAIAATGDLQDNPHVGSFLEWIRDTVGVTEPILTCPGNWDTEVIPTNAGYGNVPDSPFATYLARHGTQEGYVWDCESVRLISFNSNSPTEGTDYYWNCNPPGNESGNPDHSNLGFVDGPDQSSHPWKVGLCHRAGWVAWDDAPRPMNRAVRQAVKRLSILLQGDAHVGCIAGPFEGDELVKPGDGTWAICGSGGFVTRDANPGVLPEGSILWHSGASGGLDKTHAAVIDVTDEVNARVRMWEATTADPTGSVVFDTLLARRTWA